MAGQMSPTFQPDPDLYEIIRHKKRPPIYRKPFFFVGRTGFELPYNKLNINAHKSRNITNSPFSSLGIVCQELN
jgi:hypothetical protein